MLRVGENLNVMVKKIGTAMKDRDPKPIQELAMAEAKAGVDFIDINLGPARKGGGELMEWIVKVVQEVGGYTSVSRYHQHGSHRSWAQGIQKQEGKGCDQFDHGPS